MRQVYDPRRDGSYPLLTNNGARIGPWGTPTNLYSDTEKAQRRGKLGARPALLIDAPAPAEEAWK